MPKYTLTLRAMRCVIHHPLHHTHIHTDKDVLSKKDEDENENEDKDDLKMVRLLIAHSREKKYAALIAACKAKGVQLSPAAPGVEVGVQADAEDVMMSALKIAMSKF